MSDPLAAVRSVTDPVFGKSLGALKMVEGVDTPDGGSPVVKIALPIPGYPERDELTRRIRAAVDGAEVGYRTAIRGLNAGGRLGLSVKNMVAVGSGKGGVGKSTVAAALALGLADRGAAVGLIDADIYGPSLPHLFGVAKHGPPEMIERRSPDGQVIPRMVPVEAGGIKMASSGFLIKEGEAAVLRGPMVHKFIVSFMSQVEWGVLDYLILDLPPGTGDVSLSLSQTVGLSGAVVVCTPQELALLDATKAVHMYRQLNVPVLGMVENMSGDLFGRGGAKAAAGTLDVPFLGEVPADPTVRELGDAGRIADLFDGDGPAVDALRGVCTAVAVETARGVLKGNAGPTLEVL